MANKEKRIEMLIKKNISDILLFELHDKEVGFVKIYYKNNLIFRVKWVGFY